MEAGLKVDDFAPRLSFFFNSTMDFFEEIAKFRAARRIWSTVMREKYGARNPRSLLMRFHTQTSGASLTWQQPLNNVVRTALEALAGVLGGTQSLHTNSYDEAWALPSEKAVQVALRTQQIIAEETGATRVMDPLGGSYYVEWLTEQMEEEAYKYFDRIESAGGILRAIKTGYLQREIAENSYRLSRRVEDGKDGIVGVNKYEEAEKTPIDTLKVDFRAQRSQIESLRELRRERDGAKVVAALARIEKAYENEDANSSPPCSTQLWNTRRWARLSTWGAKSGADGPNRRCCEKPNFFLTHSCSDSDSRCPRKQSMLSEEFASWWPSLVLTGTTEGY